MKLLSQTGHTGSTKSSTTRPNTNIFQLYKEIVQREGLVRGLWAGNGVNLIRIFPAKAVVFASNDVYKRNLQELIGGSSTGSTTKTSKTTISFVAGSLAGMTATAVTYPLDLIRGRISGTLAASQASNTAVKKHYSGIMSTLVLTVRDEGFLALYRGVTPTLLGAIPYEGIKFGTVGVCESVLFPKTESSYDASTRKLLFGGLGGVLAGLITYPNDTIRRLLQLQGSRSESGIQYRGYFHCLTHTVQTQGISRLYSGLGINLIRMAPNTALQFYAYAKLKEWSDGII